MISPSGSSRHSAISCDSSWLPRPATSSSRFFGHELHQSPDSPASSARLRPAFHDSRGHADRQRIGGHVRVTTAPAPVYAPSPTSTGATSTELDPVRAPGPIRGAVLVAAVVVRGDRAGADVGARTDLGVAHVREVGQLGALADLGVLGLDEAARPGRRAARTRAGAEVGERAHVHVGPDGRRRAARSTRSRRRRRRSSRRGGSRDRSPRRGPTTVRPSRIVPGSSRTSGASSTVVST